MNVSYPCDLPPFFKPELGIPEAIHIIQATIAVLAALVGAPINIYLFLIILKYPELRQRSLLLSIQIIAVEILYHLTVPITILVSTINGTWVLGDILCDIIGVIHDAFAMFRFTMTLVLTTDRFLSVYKPFFHFKHGNTVSCTLSALVWVITFIRIVLPLTGILNCYVYIPTFKTCTIFPSCSDQCKQFAAWSIGHIVFCGVVIPLILYTAIFCIMRTITRYHIAIQESVTKTKVEEENAKENLKKYTNILNSRKRFVTISILLISIIGTTPAFTLYMASIFHPKADTTLFIVNMLIGRTSFNIIPLFDAIAFSRHHDIKKVSSRIFRSVKARVLLRSSHLLDEQQNSYRRRKSLTSTTTIL